MSVCSFLNIRLTKTNVFKLNKFITIAIYLYNMKNEFKNPFFNVQM